MTEELSKDVEKRKKEHAAYSLRIDEIDQTITELRREREELRVKAVYTWDRMKHVEKMIEG